MVFVKKNLHITEKQNDFLLNRPEFTVAEHVRKALDLYIDHIINSRASTSPSKYAQSK